QAARYVMLLAQAVQHAHRHGIIHRDIKPSNVLMDADDQPHLTDFGLAKRLGGEDSSQTRTGAIMGTPSYMAPEQAEGRIRELGPACDIYSLGAVLYELLTGRPPFRSDSPIDTLKHVLELEPAPPRLLNPKIDHDLETICLKCLQKDPQRRYATAEALADDLNRYLSGETITARSFNVLDRLARTLDRSQHDIEFRSWGNLLLYFAAIVFVGHILMFVVIYRDLPRPLHWLTRLGQFALMGVLFWRFRARRLLPASNAERELWTIWLGYLTAYAFTVGASILMSRRGEPWDELTLYPFAAVLTGLAFFVMGSSYWGRCYTIGLAFFALAVLMSLSLTWAPLEFGSLWGLSLLGLGWHVRKLGTGGSG
ncbi:MAG: serine/threonine protein kinase, partial [Planctomycetes bacterium]|nr:serine/threonine protein kinase [Planctomycetota bacterium]